MPNLSHSLITDLLSDDFEMLHNGEHAPHRISIFYDPEANKDVREAIDRISSKLMESIDPDDIYAEARRYMGFLNGTHIMFTPSILVLVLFYKEAAQRVLELQLTGDKARLHFHK